MEETVSGECRKRQLEKRVEASASPTKDPSDEQQAPVRSRAPSTRRRQNCVPSVPYPQVSNRNGAFPDTQKTC
ncbi:unnamed protein product [Gadus morhua 'NCC']